MFLLQAGNRWANDALFYFLHPFFCGKGNRRDTAHSTSVQSCVVFANTFVIFCFGQDFVVFSISEHEYAAFNAAQKLFNHHVSAGVAKHAIEHFAQFLLRFF